MVPPLDYFASGRNYSMKADSEIGLVPPLAHFASGGNYPIIRMMKSEWLPLPDPCSHICLCPNRIDSFENINLIFGVDAGVIFKNHEKSIYRLLGLVCILLIRKKHEISTSQHVCRWFGALF